MNCATSCDALTRRGDAPHGRAALSRRAATPVCRLVLDPRGPYFDAMAYVTFTAPVSLSGTELTLTV